MKRLVFAFAVLVLSQSSLFAADRPPSEVFGGYSFVVNNGSGARVTSHGWNASYHYNIDSMLGITGDFSGFYKAGVHTHIYSAGPQINLRQEKTNVFARVLGGSVHTTGSNGFVMTIGGGLDVKASDAVKVRVGQVDWMPVRMNGSWDNTPVRVTFGVAVNAW